MVGIHSHSDMYIEISRVVSMAEADESARQEAGRVLKWLGAVHFQTPILFVRT